MKFGCLSLVRFVVAVVVFRGGGGGGALFLHYALLLPSLYSHSERMLSLHRGVECSQTRCIKWAGECKTFSVEFGLFDTSVLTNEQRS